MRPRNLPFPEMTATAARPFVKWAGGKGALVEAIAERIPRTGRYHRYFEPFLGAGAVLFWIRRTFPALPAIAGDSNQELVNAYRALRYRVEEVVAALEVHEQLHGHDHYYRVRAGAPGSTAERAARFIYLNHTCYNGLYRVNRRGEFNVPMGRYRRPRILDRENLLAVSAALQGVDLRSGDFESTAAECGEGCLVYLDPPYYPLSKTSHFTSYTCDGFGADQQRRLAEFFQRLARRGATVILSNSGSEFVRELYRALSPAPRIDEV